MSLQYKPITFGRIGVQNPAFEVAFTGTLADAIDASSNISVPVEGVLFNATAAVCSTLVDKERVSVATGLPEHIVVLGALTAAEEILAGQNGVWRGMLSAVANRIESPGHEYFFDSTSTSALSEIDVEAIDAHLQAVETRTGMKPLLLPTANGTIPSALKYIRESSLEHALYPVKFSMHKSNDQVPHLSEDEIVYLRSFMETHVPVVVEEDVLSGTTARELIRFLGEKLEVERQKMSALVLNYGTVPGRHRILKLGSIGLEVTELFGPDSTT